jgi:hypothetical protein
MIRKMKVNNKIMDVIDEEEYNRRSKLPEPLFEDTCIEKDGIVYPIQKRYDGFSTGVYDAGPFFKYTPPTQNPEEYSADKIIDLSKAKDLKEIMEKQDELRGSEEAILSTKDNIFIPTIAEDETPELQATKLMLLKKKIDLESYKARFGNDGPNALRIVKDKTNKTISFYRFKNFCEVCDVNAYLILEDKVGAINPMGETIRMPLTSEE